MFVALRNSFKGQTQIMHHNIPNITSILTDHCGCRLTFDVTNLRHVVFNFHPIPKNWKLTQVQKINTGKTRVLGTFINDFGSNYVSSLLSPTTGVRITCSEKTHRVLDHHFLLLQCPIWVFPPLLYDCREDDQIWVYISRSEFIL